MRCWFICVFLTATLYLRGQGVYDSSYHFYYYDQKLSFFESMPARPGATVWLGDSITDGGEWAELFPGIPCLNRGISSDNTFGLLNRVKEVLRHRPARVFILIGINDIARGIPDSVILRNYRRLLDSFRQQSPRTRVFVQSILPTNNAFSDFKNHQNKTDHILALNRQLEQICRERKIRFVNLYDSFTNTEGKLDPRYTNDGLHLTGEGYLRWKQVLLRNKCL